MSARSVRVVFEAELPADHIGTPDASVVEWVRSELRDPTLMRDSRSMGDAVLRPICGTLRITRDDREVY